MEKTYEEKLKKGEIWTAYPKSRKDTCEIHATRNFEFGGIRGYAGIFPPLENDSWRGDVGRYKDIKTLVVESKNYDELGPKMNELLQQLLKEENVEEPLADLEIPTLEDVTKLLEPSIKVREAPSSFRVTSGAKNIFNYLFKREY